MRQAILVLGMHRSGTSALTRVLNLLGAALPKHVIGAALGNEAGHWEPERLVYLHEDMLAEAGSRWDDWRAFDPATLGSARVAYYKAEIERLITEEYGDAPLIVIKDPRICRFVPLYEEVLAELGFELLPVLCLRDPPAVADSLAARDGMSRNYGVLLWLRHVLDAVQATLGQKGAVLRYEDLLANPTTIMEQLSRDLAIQWPIGVGDATSDLQKSLRKDLQHHRESATPLEPLPELAADVATSVLKMASNPSPDLPAELQKASQYLTHLEQTSSVLQKEWDQRERRLKGDLTKLRSQMDESITSLQALNASLTAQKAEQQTRIDSLETLHTSVLSQELEKKARIEALETLNASLLAQKDEDEMLINSLETLYSNLLSQSAEHMAQIESLKSRLNEINRSKVWKAVVRLRLAKPITSE